MNSCSSQASARRRRRRGQTDDAVTDMAPAFADCFDFLHLESNIEVNRRRIVPVNKGPQKGCAYTIDGVDGAYCSSTCVSNYCS